MAIGDKIRILRTRRGWTQKELAKELGIHPVNMTKLETGVTYPSMDTLVKLAKIFAVPTDYMLFDEIVNTGSPQIGDSELLRYFERAAQMQTKDREIVRALLEAFIMKEETWGLVCEGEEQNGKKE